MQKDFFKITGLYAACVILFFYAVWSFIGYTLPEAKLDIVQALSGAFGINLPDSFSYETHDKIRALMVVATIVILSLGLIVLNVFFSAVITARLIQPRVALLTSARGALSVKWNAERPHLLVRLSNFHKADLVDVTLEAVLTVEEVRSNGIKNEQFLCYLPIPDVTPRKILFMPPRMPWTIAVPADIRLGNSLTRDYHFNPGVPVTASFSTGKKIEKVTRTLQILIRGTDTASYAPFVIHRKVLIDVQDGDTYTLHLHRGGFKSLPLHIDDAAELELYTEEPAKAA